MIIFVPLTLLAFVSLMSLQGCEPKESEERAKRTAEEHSIEVANYTKAIEEFIQTHNAYWISQEPLREHRLSTLNLQKTLIRPDSRPIAARVDVHDIEQEGNLYRLRLHVPGLGNMYSEDQVFLDLKCSLGEKELEEIQKHLDSLVNAAMRFNPFITPPFLVAAQIQEVQSRHHLVHRENGGTLEIIEFVATGECMQFKFLGETPGETPGKTPVARDTSRNIFDQLFIKGKAFLYGDQGTKER